MLLRIGTPEATGPFPGLQVNVRAVHWDGNERLCDMEFLIAYTRMGDGSY